MSRRTLTLAELNAEVAKFGIDPDLVIFRVDGSIVAGLNIDAALCREQDIHVVQLFGEDCDCTICSHSIPVEIFQ